jgi:uncharacterized small protein (DUF1192 family)
MKKSIDIAVRWRVRRELRVLLPIEVAKLEERISGLEREIERARLDFDRELSLLRRKASRESADS